MHNASYGRVPGTFRTVIASLVRGMCWLAVNDKAEPDSEAGLRMAVAAYNYHFEYGFMHGQESRSPFPGMARQWNAGRVTAGGNTHQQPSLCRKKIAREPVGAKASTRTYRLLSQPVRPNWSTRSRVVGVGASHFSTRNRRDVSAMFMFASLPFLPQFATSGASVSKSCDRSIVLRTLS